MVLRTIFLAVSFVSLGFAQPFQGRLDATVQVNSVAVPFQMEIQGNRGWFFNGDEKVISTSGSWQGNHLTLHFAQYASVLESDWSDAGFTGIYDRGTRGKYAFTARAASPLPASAGAPSIAGVWEMPVKSSKGEQAWRFLASEQKGSVRASILRIDGDTGTLTGFYRDGVYHLSHFSGARPLVADVTPQPNGSLKIVLNQKDEYTAVRTEQARAARLPAPSEQFHHTAFTSDEPFRFAFPDLAGNLVANTDSRFQGKVVLLAISGSWCPNCHDEAPYLQSLYRKYRAQGFEVVALSFEEADQLKNPDRLRAFIKQYKLEYTVLLAGEPDQLQAKLPQATNLNSWPTTVFLGRDGRVRGVHAGFAGHATGKFYDDQTVEMQSLIEKLLQQNLQSKR